MGWDALRQWGDDAVRLERLTGGVANDVWSVRIDGRLAVGRLGSRSDADLAWEAGLLQHLDLALPDNAAGLDPVTHDIAAQASAAWEAAVCWDDDYSIRRLAEVRGV